jgi:glucokinase
VSKDIWVGIDIGGTKTAVVISRKPPEVISRTEFPTLPAKGPQQAIDQILAALHKMLAEVNSSADAIHGIGVSCGGPLDPHTGVVQAPPNLSTWIDVPIVDILKKEFGCPVRLENDANAGAMAEHRYGAGKGTRNMVFLTMGTGLGAGLILENKLYAGSNDLAGEVGHVRLTSKGPFGHNKAGSVEGWASGGGLAQIAEDRMKAARKKRRKSLLFDLPKKRSVTAKDVGKAAAKGDALAIGIVEECGKKLGLALAILVDVLNPERIVIGGLAMRLGDLLLEPARKSLRKEALEPALAVCSVVPATLGESIGDVAALCIAMDAGE